MRSSSTLFLLFVGAIALTSPLSLVYGRSGCGHEGKRGGIAGASVDLVDDVAALSSSTSSSTSSRLVDLDLSKKRRKPWFCHDLDCPSYKLVNETEDYETRRLRPSRWVTTDVEAYSIATAQATGFTRLFDYISGKNAEQKKIEMTAPVLTHVSPGAGPFCKSKYSVSFYVGDAGAEAPEPLDADSTYLRDAPAATVFVSSSGGFLVDDFSVARLANGLREALERDGVTPHGAHSGKGGFFVAGYDPPFRLTKRHTEVWFVAGEEEEQDGAKGVA